MTTEQNHASPIPDSALRTPHSAFHEAAATNNVRALIEAFRQERDLYAARLAELQERHDRLRSLCDRLNAANELLMKRNNQIDALVDGLKRLLDDENPGHQDCGAPGDHGAADTSVPVRVRPCPSTPSTVNCPLSTATCAHCVCCDAPLVRKMYYTGDEGPFCLLCLGVRLEQQKKEATRAALAAGRNGL